MTLRTGDAGSLGEAFRARPADSFLADACPSGEQLWDGACGDLGQRKTAAIVEHTVVCGGCAEAWRLALDLQESLAAMGRMPRPASARRWLAPLAAAGLLLTLGLAYRFGLPAPAPNFRQPSGAAARSLVLEDQPLPRQKCLLLWSTGPAGARYAVLVSRENLDEVARARDLSEPRFLVPASSLADLPAGARFLWQVETRLPSGERRLSPTFFARLE